MIPKICDTPGSGLGKSRSPSDISLTETSRIYRGIADPRVQRYANMLCVLGMPTKQSPTGVTTPRPSTGRQVRHGSSAYKSSVYHAHIITKSAYQKPEEPQLIQNSDSTTQRYILQALNRARTKLHAEVTDPTLHQSMKARL